MQIDAGGGVGLFLCEKRAVLRLVEREGRAMYQIYALVSHWFVQNPFTGASVLFGGAVVAVALYTYVYDYRMLTDRN